MEETNNTEIEAQKELQLLHNDKIIIEEEIKRNKMQEAKQLRKELNMFKLNDNHYTMQKPRRKPFKIVLKDFFNKVGIIFGLNDDFK